MPRTVDVDERRDALGAAAARVIARDGLVGATLREVAAEAGLTTGALTHYFTDKRQLLAFTLEASLQRRRSQRPEPAGLAPPELLRAALVRALPADEDARLHWSVTVAFCAQAGADRELATLQRDAYRKFRSDIAGLLRAAYPDTPAPDAVMEAERLIAVVDGVAMQALFDPESWPAQRQIRAVDVAMVGTKRLGSRG